MKIFDCIAVGAGYAGAVFARCAADAGKSVLVLERRGHIGGNAYDEYDEKGVLIHKYGPHIFHTNDKKVFDFLSRFTEWNGYMHKVVAKIGDGEIPVPFNLNSLDATFGDRAKDLAALLTEKFGAETKVPIIKLREQGDEALAEIANYVYENVFLHYTLKQWGMKPEEIDPATTARVPVFISRDDRYFQDEYQGLPTDGYTPMFEKMLDHPGITVELNTDARDRLTFTEKGEILFDGQVFDGQVIYSGELDELFGRINGALPYRTLDFEFENIDAEQYQSHGTVNYTVDMPYTRITEFKHMTLQECDSTTIVREYSRAATEKDTPYYAIISPENNAMYQTYADIAAKYPNLHALGRLAEYKYYNMDAIAARAIALAEQLF
ncbi:MAG: UDP-galactopyranose mutase [Clostridia bacterium]|nr:UDP-galactopyranose mutase [Clostridia bacterium]